MIPQIKPYRDAVLLALLLLGILFFATIGVRPFANPDEGRYTEIPREMLVNRDWISPRLNGVLYFEKPPLLYWLQAVALKVGGVNEFSSRFWTAAFALIGCAATYLTGSRLFGEKSGLFAALVLGTSLLYFILSQIVILDMAVSVLISSALFAFLLAVREPPGRRRFLLCHLFFLLLALATLTKGLIGIVIPGAIIFLWVLLLNKWRNLWPFYPLTTVPLFLLVAVPWHYLAWRAHPEFAWFYFVNEHFLRYLTPAGHDRVEPIWYYFVILPIGLIPWAGFLPQSLRQAFAGGWKGFRERPETAFLIIWVLFILLFFSASSSKLAPYILPAYPPLALMIGSSLAGGYAWKNPINPRAGIYAFAVIALLLAIAFPIIAVDKMEKVGSGLMKWAVAASLILGTGSIAGFIAASKSRMEKILIVPLLTMAGIYLIFNPLAHYLKNDSTKALVMYLKEIGANPADVYSLFDYQQDLPPYLGSCVTIAADRPEEQEFGIALEPDAAEWLDAEAFLARWKQDHPQYAIVRKGKADEFAREHPDWEAWLVKASTRYYLISNKSLAAGESRLPVMD